MKNLIAIKERYLRDPLPVRLGGLAANLARVESFSTHDAHRDVVEKLLNESKFFIEWIAVEMSLPLQAELVELQRQLAGWHYELNEIWIVIERRSAFACAAGDWSKKLLASSGLLERRAEDDRRLPSLAADGSHQRESGRGE
jgi:hypothetical protein